MGHRVWKQVLCREIIRQSQGEYKPPNKSDKLKLTDSTQQRYVPVETHKLLA